MLRFAHSLPFFPLLLPSPSSRSISLTFFPSLAATYTSVCSRGMPSSAFVQAGAAAFTAGGVAALQALMGTYQDLQGLGEQETLLHMLLAEGATPLLVQHNPHVGRAVGETVWIFAAPRAWTTPMALRFLDAIHAQRDVSTVRATVLVSSHAQVHE